MSSIDKFRNSINNFTDFAKNSRFLVSIGISGIELLQFRCFEAELPGRTISVFENRTYGLFQKYPVQTSYDDLRLTFLCSSNYKNSKNNGLPEKRIFEDWMDSINPTENLNTNISNVPLYNFRYKNEYVRDIVIEHYDVVDNNLSYKVKFIDCFPIQLSTIPLNWGNEDNITLSINFAYTRWQRETLPKNNDNSNFESGGSDDSNVKKFNSLTTQQVEKVRLETFLEKGVDIMGNPTGYFAT